MTETRGWKLVSIACCVPIGWALVSPDPPSYPYLRTRRAGMFCTKKVSDTTKVKASDSVRLK